MKKLKRKPTQADLDAANAEARQYLNQIQSLERADREREAVALHEQDRAILASFCKIMENCKLPPNICAIAACTMLHRTEISTLSLWVGDMKRLAEAIKRSLAK